MILYEEYEVRDTKRADFLRVGRLSSKLREANSQRASPCGAHLHFKNTFRGDQSSRYGSLGVELFIKTLFFFGTFTSVL